MAETDNKEYNDPGCRVCFGIEKNEQASGSDCNNPAGPYCPPESTKPGYESTDNYANWKKCDADRDHGNSSYSGREAFNALEEKRNVVHFAENLCRESAKTVWCNVWL